MSSGHTYVAALYTAPDTGKAAPRRPQGGEVQIQGQGSGAPLLLLAQKTPRRKAQREWWENSPRFRLRRIMLVACHPQFMFYQTRNNCWATRQDKTMAAAAQVVRSTVPGGHDPIIDLSAIANNMGLCTWRSTAITTTWLARRQGGFLRSC
ncbi:hypothetical protein QBC33DRAFT_271421 [Phialemonium atrogriseum]|uniref:Uncharacterized protein n=1 Tax=Phialemonium atrogriseum TaxID=1093897 RepID=A0AAJ0FPR4_9PEZI|nr:uncharacterized protein QBC33DRAFT_271421 [Phialemonium atrogriseum]KAK1770548.1 hypothetical protein QBC33DRAFT_271421 [Phialemonium atrogriseum]